MQKLLFSIAVLSASIIAFQLALIQILSLTQWYHFAYMVISTALLGFGAAGSMLAVFRRKMLRNSTRLIPTLMAATGLVMAVVTDVSQWPFFRFDSYLLFAEYAHIGKLLLTYLLFFIPFFLGALAIGLVFVQHVAIIGKIYFSNLLGSGAGGALALLLSWFFFPAQLPAFIALLPVLAAACIIPKNQRRLPVVLSLLALAAIGWKCFQPPQLISSEFKSLSKTLQLPGSKIIFEKNSPFGVVQILSSPVLRYGPGMSLVAGQTAQTKCAAFINGDWFGAITDWKRTDSTMILDFTTAALPYIMAKREKVLVLQSGTGIDVAHALTSGATSITAVEANPMVVSLLQHQLAVATDSLFAHPAVTVHTLEPRTFLFTDTSHYDLVLIPMIGSFGGSPGLHALTEQFILTREAVREMWFKLEKNGALGVSCWMDYPVRNPLKILATLVEVLRSVGVTNPGDHIAAIRSWGTISFVMTRAPLQENELNRIRSFCEAMMFDPAVLPQLNSEERSRYNQLQDDQFFEFVNRILTPANQTFYQDYDFNIEPATDDRPYFSQYIKWSKLQRLGEFFGNRSVPFFEIGYLLVILSLVQITIASFVLILAPLLKIGWKGKNKTGIILYFSGIGLGYMLIEIVFIQHFILYFGNPVYAAAAVISSLLIFSGIGSQFSPYFSKNTNRLPILFLFIVCLLLLYSFILTPLLRQTIDAHFFLKLLITLLVIGPLAFCLGIPFPAGLGFVAQTNAVLVPWAWGINGCVSVISAVLATVIGVEMGFKWVMILAAVAYCLPLFVQAKWNKQI